jgi:RNA polymerase sigma factor (sigma-70 family)
MPSDGYRDLIQQAKEGDRQAMDRLLEVILPDLQLRASRFTVPNQPNVSGSDLVQKTSLQAWQKLAQFHCEGDDQEALVQFRAWTFQILQRLGMNERRYHSTQRRKPEGKLVPLAPQSNDSSAPPNGVDPMADQSTPSSHVRAEEEVDRLRQALKKMGEEDRTIMQMRFFEGLSLREIARRLDLSADHVRTRYYQTLRLLERELGGTP